MTSLSTPLCRALGLEHPILSAGMGSVAGVELAAAVSNAGGLGVLGGAPFSRRKIGAAIRSLRERTARPFGVNLILDLLLDNQVEAALEEAPPVLTLFWGDPSPYVAMAHRAGTKVFLQAGSLDEALRAAEAGVDAVIVQGVEAGGHVRGLTALESLLPAVARAVAPLPVIAAGGLADGRDVARALALGAQAVSLGTRFLASTEANASPAYKERVRLASAADTVLTKLFDVGWPDAAHRVIRNGIYDAWEAAGRPPSGERPGEGAVAGVVTSAGKPLELPRYSAIMPLGDFRGDLEAVPLYAGTSCEKIRELKPAGEIVRELVEEAQRVLRATAPVIPAKAGIQAVEVGYDPPAPGFPPSRE